MKNLALFLVIVAVVVIGFYFVSKPSGPAVSPSPSAGISATPTPKVSISPSQSSAPLPSTTTHQSQVHTATIANFQFSPATVTVKQGDTVVFKNIDSAPHTVTSLLGLFDSSTIQTGASWTLTTASLVPGTYEFKCSFHPSMRGTLIVQ